MKKEPIKYINLYLDFDRFQGVFIVEFLMKFSKAYIILYGNFCSYIQFIFPYLHYPCNYMDYNHRKKHDYYKVSQLNV